MRSSRFATGCVVLILLAGCSSSAVGGQETLNQADKARDLAVQTALRNAAVAQTTYLATTAAYAPDVNTLRAEGFNVPQDVALEIMRADATSFCAQASAADSGTWHVSTAEASPTKGAC